MGGTIAVTLRKPDGAFVRMERWTNPMPDWGKDRQIVYDLDSWVEGFLNGWEEYKENEHKRGRSAETLHQLLAPFRYGLMIFDCQEKEIWQCNGYSRIQLMTALSYRDPDLKWLFDEGRVRSAKYIDEGPRYHYELTNQVIQLDQFRDLKHQLGDIVCDLSPWKFRHYVDTVDGFNQMLKDVAEAFPLTVEDLDGWQVFLKEMQLDA